MPLPALTGRRWVLYQYRQAPEEPWRTGITTDTIWNEYGGASWDGRVGRQLLRWVPNEKEAQALKHEIEKREGDIQRVRYVKDGQETLAWENSDLEKGLQQDGWTRKYGPLETFGRSALGSSLFNWGEEAVAAAKTPFTDAGFKENLRALEDKRKESASERPVTGFLGGMTGATVGSPLPGGLGGAKAGLSYGQSAARLAATGVAASALAGAGASEGGITDRLKAGGKAAVAGVPWSVGFALPLANFARKPTNIDPLDAGDLSWTTPSAYVTNPEQLRNAAGLARISSLRASPGVLGAVAEKLGRDTPGIDSTSALIRWGRDLNDARVPGDAAGSAWNLRPKPVLGVTDTAPKLERAFIDETKRAGEQIGAIEQIADQRGAQVDLGEFLSKIQSGPARKLDANRARPQKLGPELMDTVKRTALPPADELVQFPPQKETVLAGATVGNGNKLSPVYETRSILPNATVSTPPRFVPASRLNEAARMMREYAKEVGGGPMGETVHPYGKTMGSAVDESAGIASGMATTANKSVLDATEQAALDDAKKRFATFKTGEEAVNPMRSAAAAPHALGSIIEGGAFATAGAAAGADPGTIITLRQLGRMMGKQRNINPSRATNLTRLAEALEGSPQNRGWQAVGLGAKGAQHLPSAIQKGLASDTGEDAAAEDSWLWAVANRLMQNKEK
jgi:hypothetical protein